MVKEKQSKSFRKSKEYKKYSKAFEDRLYNAMDNFEIHLRISRSYGYGEFFKVIKKKLLDLHKEFKDIEPFNHNKQSEDLRTKK